MKRVICTHCITTCLVIPVLSLLQFLTCKLFSNPHNGIVVHTMLYCVPLLGYHFQLRLLHHKPSGKLAVKTELVTITNDYKVMSSPSSHRHGHLKGAPEEVCTLLWQGPLLLSASSDKTPDPTANLTFDLTMNEREKEERGKLVLPYHHSAEKKRALLLVCTSHGTVHFLAVCWWVNSTGWLW